MHSMGLKPMMIFHGNQTHDQIHDRCVANAMLYCLSNQIQHAACLMSILCVPWLDLSAVSER